MPSWKWFCIRSPSQLVDLYCLFFLYSDLELKPQGKLSVTVVKATSLKNKELIGKSDPYVRLYVRPMFKVKTKVIDDNLNPEWNETFELIVEDKETQSVIFEVILYLYMSTLSISCSNVFHFLVSFTFKASENTKK